MPAAPLYHTAAMVRDLIREDRAWPRYELVHGELLVTPAPRPWHQEVAARLAISLRDYLGRQPGTAAYVFLSPADISWGSDSLVQPDVFVVPIDQARTLEWGRITRLCLAIEILSPSSLRADRFTKRRLYQEQGVPLYWVIDADGGSAEIWTPVAAAPVVERRTLRWHPDGAEEPFALSIEELLSPI